MLLTDLINHPDSRIGDKKLETVYGDGLFYEVIREMESVNYIQNLRAHSNLISYFDSVGPDSYVVVENTYDRAKALIELCLSRSRNWIYVEHAHAFQTTTVKFYMGDRLHRTDGPALYSFGHLTEHRQWWVDNRRYQSWFEYVNARDAYTRNNK